MQQAPNRVVIVGGGAAGFFAAITCAEKLRALNPAGRVLIYEATEHPLAKVRISGGGRCNVTHACFDPREFAKRYPRGNRELIGPLSKFGPRETEAWFLKRGVYLKAEPDGRMFPTTDNSWTIIDCLKKAMDEFGVQLTMGRGVTAAKTLDKGGFEVSLVGGGTVDCDRLLIATGGNAESAGLAIARSLGHSIETPVPSLFTFRVEDPRLTDLAGLSVEHAEVRVQGTKLKEEGPLLITHWGLSGPAILKLSAWGARDLAEKNYGFALRVNWAPPHVRDSLVKELASVRIKNPKKQLGTWCPLPIPLRLWERFLAAASLAPTVVWTGVSNTALSALAAQITEGEFTVLGKSANKDEFVTCGGVRLSEVDFHTMESRICPGLHFAGEVLDIDGITGGFNFQSAWTTGWLAGNAMAEAR
jgi:hypothetical protein